MELMGMKKDAMARAAPFTTAVKARYFKSRLTSYSRLPSLRLCSPTKAARRNSIRS